MARIIGGTKATYRKAILLPPATAAITNFALTVAIVDDAAIGATCRADGYDIRFADAYGNLLTSQCLSFVLDRSRITARYKVLLPTWGTAAGAIYVYWGDQNAAAYSVPITDANLLAEWHFEETSGTTSADATGNGHTITWTNVGSSQLPGTTPGVYGNGYHFVGGASSGYGTTPGFAFTGQFMFEAWVKVPYDIGTYGCNLLYQYDSLNTHTGAGLLLKNTGFTYSLWQGGFLDTVMTMPLVNYKWYHVCYGRDSNNQTFLYVNGVSAPSTTGGVKSGAITAAPNLYIGCDVALDHSLIGYVDEPRVHNVARPAEWIQFTYATYANLAFGPVESLGNDQGTRPITLTLGGRDGDTPTNGVPLDTVAISSPSGVYDTTAQKTFFAFTGFDGVYVGGTCPDGSTQSGYQLFYWHVGQVDHTTGAMSLTASLLPINLHSVGYHAAATIAVLPNGKLMVVANAYNSTSFTYWISTNAHDPTSWGSPVEHNIGTALFDCIFPRIFVFGTKTYVVFRSGHQTNAAITTYNCTTDTWDTGQELIYHDHGNLDSQVMTYQMPSVDPTTGTIHLLFQCFGYIYYIKHLDGDPMTTWRWASGQAMTVTWQADPAYAIATCDPSSRIEYGVTELDANGGVVAIYGDGAHFYFLRIASNGTITGPNPITTSDNLFDGSAIIVDSDGVGHEVLRAFCATGTGYRNLPTVYAGTNGAGGSLTEWISTDGGSTWTETVTVLDGPICYCRPVVNRCTDGQCDWLCHNGPGGAKSVYMWGRNVAIANEPGAVGVVKQLAADVAAVNLDKAKILPTASNIAGQFGVVGKAAAIPDVDLGMWGNVLPAIGVKRQ